ncbi:MAG: sulfatase [Armatimonadota bacterium]
MKLIVIVSDTFRYDHIGASGNQWIKTPELDALASESVLFERQYTASFPTIPQRTDLMTGRYTFGFRGWTRLMPEDVMLAEVLKEAGYGTQLIADTSHLIRSNFSRGFDGWFISRGQEGDIPFTRFNYEYPERISDPAKSRLRTSPTGEEIPFPNLNAWINREWSWEEDRFPAVTARHVSKWLEENYKRDDFFLWVDMFDPHEPWNPPEYLVDLYDPDYEGPPMLHPNYGHASDYTDAELNNLKAHYAAEVTLVSKWIGHILRKIEDLQIEDDTIVVFTTDHGMYLGEHDRTGKSNINDNDERGAWPLYEQITHIPLMIRVPGGKRGRCDAMIQPPDIMPTLLDLLGVEIPSCVQGESFARLVEDPRGDWSREYVFSARGLPDEPTDLAGPTIRNARWSLHIQLEENRPHELYDLDSDPQETDNVFEENPEIAARLKEALVSHLESIEAAPEKIAVVQEAF